MLYVLHSQAHKCDAFLFLSYINFKSLKLLPVNLP